VFWYLGLRAVCWQGWEAVARLRCSQGLCADKFYGPFYRRRATDMDLPAISCDASIAIQLRHEEKLPESGEAYLQFALLYTTQAGERRIRCCAFSSRSGKIALSGLARLAPSSPPASFALPWVAMLQTWRNCTALSEVPWSAAVRTSATKTTQFSRQLQRVVLCVWRGL
jgi:Sec23/Sec24 beta-sandwich domain